MREPSRQDRAARERIRTSLDESLLVEAAAGTGKTTQLVARLVNVLRTGRAKVKSVVAVTFTRKAAGEMKLKLRQELDKARAAASTDEERRLLEEAIAQLEEAHIGTIHSFCAELLRERPVEAGIDPGFEELDEDQSTALYNEAFRRWVERRLDEMPRGLKRALSRLGVAPGYGSGTPLDRIRRAGRELVEWRDFPASWRREPFDLELWIDRLTDELGELAALAARSRDAKDFLKKSLEPVETLAAWIERSEAVAERDYDALEARLLAEVLRDLRRNRKWKGRGETYAKGLPRREVLAARDQLIAHLEEFAKHADADLAAELKDELDGVVADYEELKKTSGKIDFLDLLLRARDLVAGDARVRGFFQRRFSHIFVDEFQDTDPLQAELLLLLAAADPEESDWRRVRPAPGKLFLVGDPKQSIYRFRRADVLLYQTVKEQLERAGVGVVYLTRSFRSVAPIQHAVNAAFAPLIEEDKASGQPDYVALEPDREGPDDQPSLLALPVPRPYGGWGRIAGKQIDESLPDAVAAWVDWLIGKSGWKVREGDGRVPVAPHHVCLLFKRYVSWGRDVTDGYVRAFEARGVPHVLVGGRSLHQREEVETLRTALTAIEWPDDELSVFATLKGALFAIEDAALLRYRAEAGRLHPFRPPPDDLAAELEPVTAALAVLAELNRRRNRLPIAATIDRLLRTTRAHAAFAIRPAGNQALANVQQVIDLARRFELTGGVSFRAFVEWLTAEAEQMESRQTPMVEEGAEGVRLMTVHAAKGLQYPVVVLADMTAKPSGSRPDRTVDAKRELAARRLLGWTPWELEKAADLEMARDRVEGVRVAYVASTRARDLLVVPALGDEEYESGWVAPLNAAIYPDLATFRKARPAPGCPSFGPASVMERPQSFDGEAEISVHPGLHTARGGDHEVVWWDPKALELDVEESFGVRQEQMLADDAGGVAAAGLERYRSWQRASEELVAAGARPSLEVERVSVTERPAPGGEREIEVEVAAGEGERPAGKRFGTLVHSLLRDLAFDAPESALRELAKLHGRVLEATEAEVTAAIDAVRRAHAAPALARAAASSRVHRETPFVLELDDGTRLEGVFDLVYADGDGWVVVDYKTDLARREPPPAYRRQLGWYLYAAERLLGAPARGVLLAV